MSIRASVYIATTVDGFIARPDGSIDWLSEANALLPEGEDCGFSAFMDSIDTLIMGRRTYEQVLSFGRWPYGETPVVVLSHNPVEIPAQLSSTVSCSSEPPKKLLYRLSSLGATSVYVDGGCTIRGFLAEALINEITITIIPVVIGDGIPLFGPLREDVRLTHVSTTAYDFGFVQTTYRVEGPESSVPAGDSYGIAN